MIFDMHCDTIMRIYQDNTELKTNSYHISENKMIKGGSLVQFFAMFINMKEVDNVYTVCNEMIDVFDREIAKSNVIRKGTAPSDIGDDHITGILTIEEGGAIQGDMDKLIHFYNRGVRSIVLTWNYENEIGYPNYEYTYKDKGLKPFGIEVVKKMNELGMIVDVSHLSDGGFWDCIKYSNKPIIASHSNARAVHDHPRNLTNEMILALRDKGGVMGINFYSGFLDGSNLSKVSSIVKHIKYIKDLAGIDVIALGTDYDGINCELEIEDISKMDMLKKALEVEGFTAEEIDKIFYKNALRVYNEVVFEEV